ncbi:MAG TPA: hypothetical protein VIK57_00845 [Streptosporangiaceae bacterium]
MMLGEGAASAFLAPASAYAVAGIATFPGSLPAARQVGALAQGSFALVAFTIAFMFLLFPTGTLPSRRWLPVAAAGLLLAGLATAGLAVHPGPVALPAPGGVSLSIPNPLGAGNLGPVLGTLLIGTFPGVVAALAPFLAAALVLLNVRYRAGGQLLRQQGQVARPDRRGVRRRRALRRDWHRSRTLLVLAGHHRVYRRRGLGAAGRPGGDDHRDPQAPAV